MAIVLLDIELAARVRLCDAPLVEGTLAEEAQGALQPKQAQLGEASLAAKNPPLPQGKSFSWTVLNPHGLHALPAARLVETLAPLYAELVLEKIRGNASTRAALTS